MHHGKEDMREEGLHSLSLSIKQKTSHTLALAANCFLLEARKALLSFVLAQDRQPLHDTATLSFFVLPKKTLHYSTIPVHGFSSLNKTDTKHLKPQLISENPAYPSPALQKDEEEEEGLKL